MGAYQRRCLFDRFVKGRIINASKPFS